MLQRKTGGVQLPFPEPSHRWRVLCVDLLAALAPFTSSPFHSLRSVQLCAWLTVRSLFTSDQKFSLQVRWRVVGLARFALGTTACSSGP